MLRYPLVQYRHCGLLPQFLDPNLDVFFIVVHSLMDQFPALRLHVRSFHALRLGDEADASEPLHPCESDKLRISYTDPGVEIDLDELRQLLTYEYQILDSTTFQLGYGPTTEQAILIFHSNFGWNCESRAQKLINLARRTTDERATQSFAAGRRTYITDLTERDGHTLVSAFSDLVKRIGWASICVDQIVGDVIQGAKSELIARRHAQLIAARSHPVRVDSSTLSAMLAESFRPQDGTCVSVRPYGSLSQYYAKFLLCGNRWQCQIAEPWKAHDEPDSSSVAVLGQHMKLTPLDSCFPIE